MVSYAGLFFERSIDISDLNGAFEDSLVSLPVRSNALPFDNHFLKGPLNGFCFRFRADVGQENV